MYDTVLDRGLPDYPEPLPPGNYVKLVIADSGHGIPEDMLDKIFDPFFTTKTDGTGSGMGLAVVHGIVKNHGGSISVVSCVDQGTTFSVFLPASDKAALPEEAGSGSLPGGCERVMFVDDEKALVDLGRQILERIGYRVEAFTSSKEAYAFFCQNAETIDLVITDLTMPEMTGKVLAEKIRAKSSKVPIIICTGYSENFSAQVAHDLGFKGFTLKPLVTSELAVLVRTVLDASKSISDGQALNR